MGWGLGGCCSSKPIGAQVETDGVSFSCRGLADLMLTKQFEVLQMLIFTQRLPLPHWIAPWGELARCVTQSHGMQSLLPLL